MSCFTLLCCPKRGTTGIDDLGVLGRFRVVVPPEQNYLATTAKHGQHAFDALVMLAEGRHWLPTPA